MTTSHATSIGVAALLGLLIGTVVNALAWSVPRHTASTADGPRAWTTIASTVRTLRPSTPIAVRRPTVELATAMTVGLMTWRFGLSALLPAYGFFAIIAVLLTVIDLQHHRLPNVVVLPSIGICAALLALAAAVGAEWIALGRALIAGAVLFVVFLVMALVARGAMGMGDVKLAGLVGMMLGYLSWPAVVLGAVGAFVIAAVVGVALLATRRAGRETMIAFGPSMLCATVFVVVLQLL